MSVNFNYTKTFTEPFLMNMRLQLSDQTHVQNAEL
jgi:hypothetical protein